MNPLDQYQKLQAMVKKDARDIAIEVYKELGTSYGVAKVPLHYHNGVDAPQIPPQSVTDFETLPATIGGMISPGILLNRQLYFYQKGQGLSTNVTSIPVFPLPVISGDITPENFKFTGGNAPDGTLFIYKEASDWQLWIRLFGSWHGVSLTLTPSPQSLGLGAGLAGGATSGGLSVPWPNITGNYSASFSNGDFRTVTFTNGSTGITWAGPLSGPATASISVQIN